MIIVMRDCSEKQYYKIVDKYTSKELNETEKEIKEKLKLIKFTLDVADDYTEGDYTAHIDTCIENRIEIYEKVLSKFGINIKFKKVSHEEICDL